MEEIDLIKIEELAKNKNYSELSATELKLINSHFENEKEYNSFRNIIAQEFEEDFPIEIDNVIFDELNKNDNEKVFPIFQYLRYIAAIILLLISFFSGWFLNTKNETKIVEIIKTKTDTLYIENNIVKLDTINIEKLIYKEKIVKVFIEKEIPKAVVNNDIFINYDSIANIESNFEEIVENNTLENQKDLSSFFTTF